MKLLFDCHLDETPFFIELMGYLENEHGIESAAVTLGKRRLNQLSDKNFKVYNVSDYINTNQSKIQSAIKEIDKYSKYKVGDFNLNRALSGERYYNSLSKKEFTYLLIGSILFWEELFDNYDYIVGPGMAFTLHFTAYLASVTSYEHSRYLAILTTRNPDGRITFCDNHSDSWTTVKIKYNDLLSKNLTPEQDQLASNFINEFREKRDVPGYMKLKYQSPKIRTDQVFEVFKRYFGYYIEGWMKDRYDYYNQPPGFYIKKYLYRFIKSYFDRQYFRNKMLSTKRDNKFFYYPLHFEPEATTLVQSPLYVDQINFLKNISKSLPIGYTVIVKEHPSSIGYRSRNYYQQIENIRNITLVSPHVDSHGLIKNANAVIVLSGTVGWEALLYATPVISFGDAFYNDSQLTYKCNHFNELSGIIENIEENDLTNDLDYTDKLKKFIVALYEGTYPGYFTVPKFNARVMNNENIINVADALLKEVVLRESTT